MKFALARREDPRIDVTPMIDIVFQLVLFFMVSTTFASAPGFEVELPSASSQTVVNQEEELEIWVTLDGEVVVEDAPMDGAIFESWLREHAEKTPNAMVVLKADVGVSHGRVVEVMDLARTAGLTRLAIATEIGRSQEEGRTEILDQRP